MTTFRDLIIEHKLDLEDQLFKLQHIYDNFIKNMMFVDNQHLVMTQTHTLKNLQNTVNLYKDNIQLLEDKIQQFTYS